MVKALPLFLGRLCPVFHLPLPVLLLSACKSLCPAPSVFHGRFHCIPGLCAGHSDGNGSFFHWLHWGLDQFLLNMQVKLALGLCSEWFGWVVGLAFCFWRQIHCLLQLASGKACEMVLSALHEAWPRECGLSQGSGKLRPLQGAGIQPWFSLHCPGQWDPRPALEPPPWGTSKQGLKQVPNQIIPRSKGGLPLDPVAPMPLSAGPFSLSRHLFGLCENPPALSASVLWRKTKTLTSNCTCFVLHHTCLQAKGFSCWN